MNYRQASEIRAKLRDDKVYLSIFKENSPRSIIYNCSLDSDEFLNYWRDVRNTEITHYRDLCEERKNDTDFVVYVKRPNNGLIHYDHNYYLKDGDFHHRDERCLLCHNKFTKYDTPKVSLPNLENAMNKDDDLKCTMKSEFVKAIARQSGRETVKIIKGVTIPALKSCLSVTFAAISDKILKEVIAAKMKESLKERDVTEKE